MIQKIFLSLFVFVQSSFAVAQITATYTIKSGSICHSENSLVILSGDDIPKTLGMNIENLSMFRLSGNKKQPIIFQIDQKDAEGRYRLNNNSQDNSKVNKRFGKNDELVFRNKDLGHRLNPSTYPNEHNILIEIKVISEQKKSSDWVYMVLDNENSKSFKQSAQLFYESGQDIITSPVYKMGFSKDKPFLLNAFHWNLSKSLSEPIISEKEKWSSDMTDTMKIRHIGKFLGFPFKRTDDDYYSHLLDVKVGPLRVIRRTENKIKVFWKLKSPALYIDYVMMPDGFVMDSMIDIPFKVSFFFSDLATITTMDWNNSVEKQNLMIKTASSHLRFPVNGQTSDDKRDFNDVMASEFSVIGEQGSFEVKLDIPDNFPLRSQLYLKDAMHEIDLPENNPGQFGNVGFKTTGWENIDSQLHHLKFTVCVDNR